MITLKLLIAPPLSDVNLYNGHRGSRYHSDRLHARPRQVEQSWNKEDTRWSYDALKVTVGNQQTNKNRRGTSRKVCCCGVWSGVQQCHKTMQEHTKGAVWIQRMTSITNTYHPEMTEQERGSEEKTLTTLTELFGFIWWQKGAELWDE